MKKTITFLLLTLSITVFGQYQNNAPWHNNENAQRGRTTLNSISTAAENYFNTIDRNKKGSGFKPFKRWENHWSGYLTPNGTIAPAEDLWKAWREKKNMSQQNTRNNGDWEPLGPYENSNRFAARDFQQTGQGRVNAIAVDPSNSNTYYVGSPAGGLWKSTDAGLNWAPLTDHLPQIGVSGIAIHPTNSNIIYIATGDDDAGDSYAVGVWKTTDGGSTWANTGGIPGDPDYMNEIYINPNTPETVLVATSTGVQKTTDGGTNWATVLNANILDIKMKPGDPNIWYALSATKFYKSIDGGDSFIEKNITGLSNSSRMTMDVTPANPNYIYVVSAGNNQSNFNGIYKSTNSGESFIKTSETRDIFGSTQAWYDLALTVSSSNADIVYVGVLDIWKSTNGGNSFSKINSWSNYNSPTYTHADIHFLRFINGKFFAGTDGGIYVSDNEGRNFTDLTKKIAISQFYKISISQQKVNTIAGGLQDNGGFGLTDNQWYNYHGGDGMEGIVDINNSKVFYGFTQFGGSLNVSENGGKTYGYYVDAPAEEKGTNDDGGNWVTPMTMNSSGELFAGFSQLYKLENRAWTKVSNYTFGGDLDNIEIDPNDANFIMVSNGFNLHISKDKGASFSRIRFASGRITSIEISNTDSNTVWLTTELGVYKSVNIKDAAPTFTNISLNLPSETKNIIKHHTRSGNNTIYVGTNLGVYYTNDDLTEWKTFDSGLPNTKISDLEINEEDSKLYAATYGRGVFVSDIQSQLPTNDVRLISISAPSDEIINSTNIIEPKVTIKNQGTETITNVEVSYNFNNGTTKTYNWTGNLTSESNIEISLPSENLPIGIYTLNITTTINNDAYSSNNTSQKTFLVNNFNESPTSVNSFENSDDVLLTQNNMWELGVVNKALLKTPTGSKAYATKVSGNHPDNTNGYLYTKYYNLSEIISPIFKFNMGFDIEKDWDYMVIEYSTDKGINWNVLGTADDNNWYNSNANTTPAPYNGPLPGKQWTGEGENNNALGGTNATIHNYSYDLTPLQNQSEIIFRFAFIADSATNEEGAVIDDLVIEGTLSNEDIQKLDNVLVSPNPSEGIFNLQWKPTDSNMNITVFDITGKTVLSRINIKESNYKIDLSKLNKGIYLLNLKTKNKIATKKLVLR